MFTIDEESHDLGLLQEGEIGRNGPLFQEQDGQSFLERCTWRSRHGGCRCRRRSSPRIRPPSHYRPRWPYRRSTTTNVEINDLTAPPVHSSSSVVTCWSQYYGWVQWYDPAGNPNPMSVHHSATSYKTYYFGAYKQYSQSFIANCGEANTRHRIYYWSGFWFEWKKHWDSLVTPWHWQAVTKGSVLRERMVAYDDDWGYTRAGRFRN